MVSIKRHGLPHTHLWKDQYFSLSGNFNFLDGIHGKAIVIEVINGGYYKENNYSAYATFGGPIEATGRLKYIDGCTDSLLISPVKKRRFPEEGRKTIKLQARMIAEKSSGREKTLNSPKA